MAAVQVFTESKIPSKINAGIAFSGKGQFDPFPMEALIAHPHLHRASMPGPCSIRKLIQQYDNTITSNAMLDSWKNVHGFVHLLPHDLWRGTQSTDNAVADPGRKQKFC
jgi:hypothetical protein